MTSDLSTVIFIIVAAGALLFLGYLVQDYFSRAARAARRRKKRVERKLRRIKERTRQAGPGATSAPDPHPTASDDLNGSRHP